MNNGSSTIDFLKNPSAYAFLTPSSIEDVKFPFIIRTSCPISTNTTEYPVS